MDRSSVFDAFFDSCLKNALFAKRGQICYNKIIYRVKEVQLWTKKKRKIK